MKKFIYIIAIFTLTLVASPARAGVNENKVLQILSQSITFNSNTSGAENINITVNVKTTDTQKGKKPVVENGKIVADFIVATDINQKADKLEGTLTVKTPYQGSSFSINLPFQIILTEKYAYIYMYAEYSRILRQYVSSSALDAYDNTWIRVDADIAEKAAQLEHDETVLQKGIFGSTNWFTTSPRRVGASTIYTLKINPTVLAAIFKKITTATDAKLTPAKRIKKNADMLKFFKTLKFGVTAENDKLLLYVLTGNMSGTTNGSTYDTNGKKVTTTSKSDVSMMWTGTVAQPVSIVIPTTFKDIQIEKLAEEIFTNILKPGVVTDTQNYQSGPYGFLYKIPTGYVKTTEGKSPDSEINLLSSERDDFVSRINVYIWEDEDARKDLVTIKNDMDARNILSSWSRPDSQSFVFKGAYVKNINGNMYIFAEDSFRLNYIPRVEINSLAAYLVKGNKIYSVDIQDDSLSYAQNKPALEEFLKTVEIR